MPESTTAIVGGCGSDPFVTSDQPFATPETNGHCCRLDSPASRTGASGVIALIPGRLASDRSCLPVSCAAAPLIEANRRRRPIAFPGIMRISSLTDDPTGPLPYPGKP